ncbi:hypothetical protein TRICI_002505 [Trichomonascus ciferrii]|uniref:Uncharacterized protein n=1 Tax=Trichomonascus ciferrii TaxID=44093 RepID=A0A642VBI8_9ASCO|nr:hypothetical protein TRICI_002505 [Trichomonascus ciferrii]
MVSEDIVSDEDEFDDEEEEQGSTDPALRSQVEHIGIDFYAPMVENEAKQQLSFSPCPTGRSDWSIKEDQGRSNRKIIGRPLLLILDHESEE